MTDGYKRYEDDCATCFGTIPSAFNTSRAALNASSPAGMPQ